jgi:hypothetical protein
MNFRRWMDAAVIVTALAAAPAFAQAQDSDGKRLERLLQSFPAELIQVRTGHGGRVLSAQARKCALLFKTAGGPLEVVFNSESGGYRSSSQAIIVDTANGIAGLGVPGDHEGSRYKAQFDELAAALKIHARGCGRT